MNKFLFEVIILSSVFALESLFPYLNRGLRAKLEHDAKNLGLAFCNGFLSVLFLASVTVGVLNWIEAKQWGLRNWLEVSSWVEFALLIILFDVWMYWWHRINHTLPWLWRFHRVHHSDPFLDATSGLRFHPCEIFLSAVFRLPIYVLLGMTSYHLFFYEVFLQVVVLFHHSNWKLAESVDRILRLIIVTPRLHRVHHSDRVSETNSNYGSIFSVWDRLFESFCLKQDMTALRYGLSEFREQEFLSFWGMLYRTIFWKRSP